MVFFAEKRIIKIFANIYCGNLQKIIKISFVIFNMISWTDWSHVDRLWLVHIYLIHPMVWPKHHRPDGRKMQLNGVPNCKGEHHSGWGHGGAEIQYKNWIKMDYCPPTTAIIRSEVQRCNKSPVLIKTAFGIGWAWMNVPSRREIFFYQ